MSYRTVRLLAFPALWLVVAVLGAELLEDSIAPVGGPTSLRCGVSVMADQGSAVLQSRSVRVALASDEEWRSRVPDPDGSQARRVLAEAGSLFRGVGIYFLPVRVLELDTPDHLGTVIQLVDDLQRQVPIGDFDIVILLTAQDLSTSLDGYGVLGGRHAAISHHADAPQRDVLVVAHEIAHLFGAHHGCDVPGRGGLMASVGFEGGDLICPCTRSILETNAYRFHADLP